MSRRQGELRYRNDITRQWRLGLLREAATRAYAVDVIFVETGDPTINVRRVRRRAKHNEGHLVPHQTVRRRWTRVQENLATQKAAFRSIRIIDSTNDPPVEAARSHGDETAILVQQPAGWIVRLIRELQKAGERRRIEAKDEDGGIEDLHGARVGGAEPEAALAAAEELGEVGTDVRILKWMVGMLMALVIAGFTGMAAALFQISLRLPGGN